MQVCFFCQRWPQGTRAPPLACRKRLVPPPVGTETAPWKCCRTKRSRLDSTPNPATSDVDLQTQTWLCCMSCQAIETALQLDKGWSIKCQCLMTAGFQHCSKHSADLSAWQLVLHFVCCLTRQIAKLHSAPSQQCSEMAS